MDYIRKLILKDESTKTGSLIQEIKTDWVLEVLQGEDWGRAIPLRYNYIPLGRKSDKDTDKYYELKFDDQTVSSRQAHLVWHPHSRKYGITHTRVPVVNQTYVNDIAIEPNKEIMLGDYDRVRMGKLIFVLSHKPKKEKNEEEKAERLDSIPSIAYTQTEEIIYTGFTLKVIEGNEIGFEFPIIRRKVEIKRGNKPREISPNELILSDRTVSRNQAKLVWLDEFGRLDVIHSDKATNPTKLIRVVGKRDRVIQLAPNEPETIRDGDILAMGQTYIYAREESIEDKIKIIREMEEASGQGVIQEIQMRTAEAEEAKSLGPRILEEPPASVPEEIIEEIIEDAIHGHEAPPIEQTTEEPPPVSEESIEITIAGEIPGMPEESVSAPSPPEEDRQIVLEVQSAGDGKSDMMETGMIDTDQTTSILTRKMD